MPVSELLWYAPVEIAAAGNIGGLLHYYNEWAQVIYATPDAELCTRIAFVDDGNFPGAVWGVIQNIDGGQEISDMRFDHPSLGQVFGAWISGGDLICVLYNYAADISDMVESTEISEQEDNTIRGLTLSVQNVAADMFDSEYSLFSPGASLDIRMAMGDGDLYPMGKYYLDKSPFDPFAQRHEMQGRSRAGRLLKDTTFDLYNSSAGARFTGTPTQIITAVLTRYGDGEIEPGDIVVQSSADTYTVTFDPKQGVLEGLTDWLSGKDTATAEEHATLSYGATGAEVLLAQKLINKALPATYTKLDVDGPGGGIFGPKTLAALKYVQKIKGLTVTGQVDAPTWAALLVKPLNWKLVELYDGRFIAGQPAFIAIHRPTGRYTFTRGQDVLTRTVDRCTDGCYSRVGVKYNSGGADAYVFAVIDMWPAWAIPEHKTLYMDAPDGATQAQAQTLADTKAIELQYTGVTEQVVGPIRPELLVGDIAQISSDGETAMVTGLITEVRHRLGGNGYYTTFTSDSGGAIMEDELDAGVVEVSAMSAAWGGSNRRRRMADMIRLISDRKKDLKITVE